MAEEFTGVEGTGVDFIGSDPVSKPAEPTVVINNREIPVSEASAALRQMEHDLKSGYDRRLIEERQATRDRLIADKQFYATTDPSEWEHYEPTVDGGRGWVGQGKPKMAEQVTTQPASKPTIQEVKMADQAQAQAQAQPFLETEIQTLKSQLTNIQRDSYERDVAHSMKTRDSLAAKYPNADLMAVTAQMKAWDFENGIKACPDTEVEKFMQQSHSYVQKRLDDQRIALDRAREALASSPPTTATPTVTGGGVPSGGKSVLPKLDDTDSFIEYIAGKI